MDKDLENKIRISTSEDEENLQKVVSPEAEFEIPIGNGKRKRVFWTRIGFNSRVYFKAYFRKKLKEAIESGLIGIDSHFKGSPIGDVDGKNATFTLSPSSIDESTLKVYIGSTLKKEGQDYSYSDDLRVLLFNKPPSEGTKITVEYDYYDQSVFTTLYNDCFITVLIYLCAREIDNHNKRIFDKIDDIGLLTMTEINEIISLYTSNTPFESLQPDTEKLKNSPTPPLTSEGGVMQSDGVSTLGVLKSGENLGNITPSTELQKSNS